MPYTAPVAPVMATTRRILISFLRGGRTAGNPGK
jgi:hypothetical protein